MTHHAPTIISKKFSFLNSQTRLLTTPDPLPSRAWSRTNASSEAPIPQRAIDDALSKLAQATRQHARRVYPPQAARHVAEQVERLYWQEGESGVEGVGGDRIRRDVDLSTGAPGLFHSICSFRDEECKVSSANVTAEDAVIARLPPTWPSSPESTAHPSESHRYTTQSARLASLSDERRRRRERVLRLRRMRETLRPFEESLGENVSGVQDSLLTKEGALEGELERMRVLLARVAGRVAGVEVEGGGVNEDGDAEEVLSGDRERVGKVLGSL